MRIMVLSFLLMLDVGCFSIVSRCAVESRIQELELIQPKTVSSAAGPAIGIRILTIKMVVIWVFINKKTNINQEKMYRSTILHPLFKPESISNPPYHPQLHPLPENNLDHCL